MDFITDIKIEDFPLLDIKAEVDGDHVSASDSSSSRYAADASPDEKEKYVHSDDEHCELFQTTFTSIIQESASSEKVIQESCYRRCSPLQCPACDKSFKGGISRLKCLARHVKEKHCRESRTLLRKICVKHRIL